MLIKRFIVFVFLAFGVRFTNKSDRKDKNHMISPIRKMFFKKETNELIKRSKNKLTDVDTTLVVTRGEEE